MTRFRTTAKVKSTAVALLLVGAFALTTECLFNTAAASPRTSAVAHGAQPDRNLPRNLGSRTTVKPGQKNTLSPQPLPPGSRVTTKPGDAVTLSPQPLPPGARVGAQFR